MVLFRHYESINQKGRVLIILLFSCFYSAQNITIDNKNNFPVEIAYSHKKIEIGVNQKKIINETNRIKTISISSKNDGKFKRDISFFLNSKESLSINLKQDTVKFKGDKEALHDYVNHHTFEGYLAYKITEYQKYNQNNDAKGFIRTSEMYLADVLKKIEKLNNSPLGREDVYYKEIEKLAKEQWFFTVFVSFNGDKLDNTGKELMLYYFEKYFKKDIETFSCNSWVDYDIIRKYSLNNKLLNLKLPKYEIVEHTDDDDINQYMSAKCQEYYFSSSYKFLVYKKDMVRAERYKKILIEKFHVKL